MSLLFGYDINEKRETKDSDTNVKTLKSSITFRSYNNPRTVGVFSSGIILLGITTTSGRVSPAHQGLVYYDIYNSDGSTKIENIKTQGGNYFIINNGDNPVHSLSLRKVYNIPGACSITVRLGYGSNRSTMSLPIRDPVNLDIALHYIEVPVYNFN